jgi:cysteine desulfurase/selenocysteine lyase
MFGPTGIGIAYINKNLHHQLQPYRLGGGMVHTVHMYDAEWLSMPHMLEAGTPPIAQAIGLVAAIDYLEHTIGYEALARHERALMHMLIDDLETISGITILGPVDELRDTAHLLSFIVDGVHAHDVAAYLDCHGIAVRAGHHCAQPLAQKLGITASVRVSLYAYNTNDDIQALVTALKQLVMTFPKYVDQTINSPYA